MCKLFTSVLCWDDVIFCFGVGNFFLLFSLVVFVVLSAGCVMNVDFNFSF